MTPLEATIATIAATLRRCDVDDRIAGPVAADIEAKFMVIRMLCCKGLPGVLVDGELDFPICRLPLGHEGDHGPLGDHRSHADGGSQERSEDG